MMAGAIYLLTSVIADNAISHACITCGSVQVTSPHLGSLWCVHLK